MVFTLSTQPYSVGESGKKGQVRGTKWGGRGLSPIQTETDNMTFPRKMNKSYEQKSPLLTSGTPILIFINKKRICI